MAYVPDWERLSDALKRVRIDGIADDEAKLDISRAIADRKIRVRLTVAIGPDVFTAHLQLVAKVQGLGSDPKHSAQNVECFEGANVKIPNQLTPDDFDWENSRPVQPWPYRLPGGRRDEWRLPSQPALLIELHNPGLVSWMQETYSEASLSGDVTINQTQGEGSGPGFGTEVTISEAQAAGTGAVLNGEATTNKAQDKRPGVRRRAGFWKPSNKYGGTKIKSRKGSQRRNVTAGSARKW
jgi:hypothetical protein